MLDISKSVTYIFDDPDWVKKIGIMLVVGLAAGFLLPILVGLVFVAAQTGWSVQLIRNVRQDMPNPMPDWDEFGKKMSLGAQPMIAGIVYFLPMILLSCIFFVPAALAGEDAAGALAGGLTCLLVPVFLIYTVAASVFLSMGIIRYAETEQLGDFFKFGVLWEMFTRDTSLTARYVGYYILVQLVMSAASSLTGGIGAIIPAAFGPPILGHLTGQFANALGSKPKRA